MTNTITSLLTLLVLSGSESPDFPDYDQNKEIQKQQEIDLLDHLFLASQEHFVIDSMSKQDPRKGFLPTFGKDVANLVQSLDCEHAWCRETAENNLMKESNSFRIWIWTSRSVHKRIRDVAKRVLSEKFLWFPECQGTGMSYSQFSFTGDLCYWCDGSGSMKNADMGLLIRMRGYEE